MDRPVGRVGNEFDRMRTATWYPWYPTLYRADTAHLTLAEDGAYRRLIDHYMESGRPLPDDDSALARIVGVPLNEWLAIAARIRAFFKPHKNFLKQRRCDRELSVRTMRHKRRKTQAKHAASMRWASQGNATIQDITIHNSKERVPPIVPPEGGLTNGVHHDRAPRGTRLPADWEPSADDLAFAERNGFDRATAIRLAEGFRDYWIGRAGPGGVKLDWPATWRNWVRREAKRPDFAQRPQPVGLVATVRKMLAEEDEPGALPEGRRLRN